MTAELTFKEETTVGVPPSGFRKLYAKADGWYEQDDSGTEQALGSGGGGGSGDMLASVWDANSDGFLDLAKGGSGANLASTGPGVLMQASAGAAVSVAALAAADMPTHASTHADGGTDELSIDTSQVTTGTLGLARGGSGANLASTGPGFLKQASAGAAVSVAALAAADMPVGTLKTDAALSGTLQAVKDSAGNSSALQIGTTQVKIVSDEYITVQRATAGTAGGDGDSVFLFAKADGTERGYFGYGSSGNNNMIFANSSRSAMMSFLVTGTITYSFPLQFGGASTNGNMMGFFGTAPITKPTVSGSRGSNAALASLCTALANLGLITNSTT